MAFTMKIVPPDGQTTGSVIPDVIAFASYNGLKGMSIMIMEDSVRFSHERDMPLKEYDYLLKKYGISNLSLFVELD